MACLYERDTTNGSQMVNDVERSVFFYVSFRIEPFKGKTNYYTVYKPYKVSRDHVEDPIINLHRLNHIYQEMLHGWRAERRQRETGAYDMYYYHKGTQYRSIPDVQKYLFNGCLMLEVDQETNAVKEVGMVEKHSMKRKGECSIMKRESAMKKHKSNKYDKNEVKKSVVNGRNYLINWCWHRHSRGSWFQQLVGDLVGDIDGEASNGGSDVVKEFVADGKNNLIWCWQRSSRSSWTQKIVGSLVGDNNGGASNGGVVKTFVANGRNNPIWCWNRNSRGSCIQQITGDLVGDNSGGASTGGFGGGMANDEGHVSDANGGGSE